MEPTAFTRKRNRYGRVEAAARYETLSFGSRGGAAANARRALGQTPCSAMAIVSRRSGLNWHVNRWVKVQANLIREDIGRPSMGPLPARSSFWSRVFRLQLTL